MMLAMASARWSFIFAVLCWLVVGMYAGLCSTPSRARATDLAKEDDAWSAADKKYQLATMCKTCHARPTADDVAKSLDFVLMTEYSIWKTHDKHAQAYVLLEGAQGALIGRNLGQDVRDVRTGCLNCHAMSDA